MTRAATTALLVAFVAFASSALAQPVPDHLECFQIKDPQQKTAYVADLDGLQV
jgi:hypothetical protein